MRPLSFLLAGAAMFVAALTVNAATVCQGKILNPVTDVCWSCVFPVKIGGKASLTTSVLPDPDTGAGGPFCTCGKGLNLRAGVTFSFWEPLRTAEIVRHAGCLPSMGGVNMGDMGLRISDHVKVHSHEPDGSMKRHTDFRQVHWYATPWLFILEALLDDGCLDQQTFDLAYMSELDPLWDDTLSSFILNPDAALFANPIAQGACAADCTSASSGLPQNSLYWCSGCQGNVFPLTGWSASLTSHTAVWQLMTHRFAMKLSREGLLLAAHGSKGLCESSNTWRPRITILLDTGMTSSLVETAAEELKLVGDAADVEVLVRGLPVTRTPTGYRTDFEATSERLAPLVDAGFGAAIHPERFAFLLALAEEGLEAGGRLDAKTEEVYEVMTAAPTAPAVLLTIGRSVYAVSGTASIVSALSQWRRTLADAVMDESDRTRIAALQTVLDETPLGRIAP